MMKKNLSKADIKELKECLQAHSTLSKRLSRVIIVIFAVNAIFVALSELSLLLPIIIGSALFFIGIMYKVTWKDRSQFESDLHGNLKSYGLTKIVRIKKSKTGIQYILKNGIELNEISLEFYCIPKDQTKVNSEIYLEFAPKSKYVFSVKLKENPA